ncbi:MAG: TonB-dependent receptor, partial [Sandarakinorhabdus sp.]|nr:TonB-dependent receptor [Sandarakinorhabdus sp.]
MRSNSVVLFAVLSSAPVLAQVVPETIVVTATRTQQPLNRVGQSITVIDSAEIDRRQTATVIDLLRTVPGVTVTRNGGIGGTTGVFIRGAETDQTVTLIDGVKINDPAAP